MSVVWAAALFLLIPGQEVVPDARLVEFLADDDVDRRDLAHARFSSALSRFRDAAFIIDWSRSTGRTEARSRAARILARLRPDLRELSPAHAFVDRLLGVSTLPLDADPLPQFVFFQGETPPDEESEDIRKMLRKLRITVRMKDAPLTAVIDYVREITGLNFHIDTLSVPAPEERRVDAEMSDLRVDRMLVKLLVPLGLVFTVDGGVVIITSREVLVTKMALDLYDVQDLTYGDSSLNQVVLAGEEFKNTPEGPVMTGEYLASLVMKHVHPKEWEEKKGRSVQFQNGILIVRNLKGVHRDIWKFLWYLRLGIVTTYTTLEDEKTPDPLKALGDRRAELGDRAERELLGKLEEGLWTIRALKNATRSGDPEVRARAWTILGER